VPLATADLKGTFDKISKAYVKSFKNICKKFVGDDTPQVIEQYQDSVKSNSFLFAKLTKHSCAKDQTTSICSLAMELTTSTKTSADKFNSLTDVQNRVALTDAACEAYIEQLQGLVTKRFDQFKDEIDESKMKCYYNSFLKFRSLKKQILTTARNYRTKTVGEFKEKLQANRAGFNAVTEKVINGYKKCFANKETSSACSETLAKVCAYTSWNIFDINSFFPVAR